MENRRLELDKLKCYTQKIDNEVTLILQNLQWDSKQLLKGKTMSLCKFDNNHRIPPDKKQVHEKECYLKSQGYNKEDLLLPEPMDNNSSSLVKLSIQKISEIINCAAKDDPLFKKETNGTMPLSLERIQCTYTADERRAIHDAVVHEVPSCHDLADLALLSANSKDERESKTKSRTEILAELRNMKRRRTKYRVAAKTKNYSDVLRDVIKTQMEVYTESYPENTSSNGNNSNLDISKDKDQCLDVEKCLEDNNKTLPKDKTINSNDKHYERYDKNSDGKRRKENDSDDRHKRRDSKEERRYREKHRYENERKCQIDRRSSRTASEARSSSKKYNYDKRKSYRDEQRSEKRYRNESDTSSERNRTRDRGDYYDRYYRDSKKLKEDITCGDNNKIIKEFKREKEDDDRRSSKESDYHKRDIKNEYEEVKKEVMHKRYYELDNDYYKERKRHS